MRIREFTIDSFGMVHRQHVTDLSPGVTVFLGDNEAGKSTCLNFFRAMLFGYARNRRSIDYLAHGQSLSGGSLVLESDTLGPVTLRRTRGPHGGPFTLTDIAGAPRPQEDLARLLRGCTPELYDKVFAFSLDELAHFSSLKDDSVRHALHGAAFGMGMRSPNRVLKELDEAMRRIFAPRATTSRIQQLLAAQEELTLSIAQKGNEVERYGELRQNLAEVSASLASVQENRIALEREQRRHARHMVLFRRWEDVRAAETSLASLPEVAGTFSPDGRERLDRLMEQAEERKVLAQTAKSALERAEAELAALAYDKALADDAPAIVSLLERKENTRTGVSNLLALHNERETLERSFACLCADLGPGWDREQTLACDLSLNTHETCARLGQRMAHTHATLSQTEAEHARAVRDNASAAEAYAEANAALEEAEPPVHGADGSVLDEDAADKLQQALVRAEDAHRETHALAVALRNAEQALDRSITAIAPGWTRQEMEQLAVSPADRERLHLLANTVANAETAATHSARECETARLLAEDAHLRVGMLEETLAREASEHDEDISTPGRDPEKRRLRLRRAQHARKTLESSLQTYGSANEQLGDIATLRAGAEKKGPPWGIVLLFFGVFAMVCGGGAAYIALQSSHAALQYSGIGGFIFGLSCSVAGIALLTGGRSSAFSAMEHNWTTIEQRLIRMRFAAQSAKDEAEAALASLAKEDPVLFPDGSFDADTLAEAELRVLRQSERMALLARDTKELAREKASLAGVDRRISLLEARVAEHDAAVNAARAAWREALAELGLPGETEPSDAKAMLESVDGALARHSAWNNRLAAKVAAEDALRSCLVSARSVPDLADTLASLPEPGTHMAPDPGPWLEEVRQFLSRWRHAGRERVRLGELLAGRTARKKETEALLAQAESALAYAREAASAAETAWKSWLADSHFSPSLAPETARIALETAGKAKYCLEQQARMNSRITALHDDIRSFIEILAVKAALAPSLAGGRNVIAVAAALAENAHSSKVLDPAHVAQALAFLDDIAARAQEAREQRARQQDRERELPALRDALALADEQALASREAIADIVRLGCCATPEVFRATHARWAERESALVHRNARRAEYVQEMDAMGLEEEEAAALFAETTLDAMEEAACERETARAAFLEQEQVLAERKGALDVTLEGLANEDGLMALLRRREEITEEVGTLSREWTRLAIARELLLTAKRRFETERQTGVVQHAGELFRAVTGGAYSGITVSLDDEDVCAVTAQGERKNPETELSRGTREQLYLALRLAYVRDHGLQAEKLPVVMDDILVNFDAARARRTAEAIGAFAGDFQVLFFTCHKATATLLLETAPQATCRIIHKGAFTQSVA